jgi:hypothetical protein
MMARESENQRSHGMRAGDMSEELHTELWLARISRQITEPTEQVTYNPVLEALDLDLVA